MYVIYYILYYWQIGQHNNNYSTGAFRVGHDNRRRIIIIYKYSSSTPSSADGRASGGTNPCIVPHQ